MKYECIKVELFLHELSWVLERESMHVIAQQLSGELVVGDITSKVRGGRKPCKTEFLTFSFMFSLHFKQKRL